MPPRLIFPDAAAAADALTFAGRTARVGDGAVRLSASGGTLTMTSAPFAPRGLFDATPTVLAMRALPVDPELVCDLVIEASDLVGADDSAAQLELPETALSPAWAGVSPPRGGWEQTGTVAASLLVSRAQWGVAAVAEALPQNPGEDAVRAVRAAGGVPLVMTSWNLVLHRGVDAFADDLLSAGGGGLITPDLTPDEAGEWIAASDRPVWLSGSGAAFRATDGLVQRT